MPGEEDLSQMVQLTYPAAYISNNKAFEKYVRTNTMISNTLPPP